MVINICRVDIPGEQGRLFAYLFSFLLAILTGISSADLNPIGTWGGVDQENQPINMVLYEDGTTDGTWGEDLDYCYIYWDLSGIYNL